MKLFFKNGSRRELTRIEKLKLLSPTAILKRENKAIDLVGTEEVDQEEEIVVEIVVEIEVIGEVEDEERTEVIEEIIEMTMRLTKRKCMWIKTLARLHQISNSASNN